MDPISTSALSTVIGSVLKPTTDAAGKRVLAALRSLVRRIPGPERDGTTTLDTLEGDEAVDIQALAAALVSAAGKDPAFEAELRTWLSEATTVIEASVVSNVNTGSVTGPLVQGRDFSGPMNIK